MHTAEVYTQRRKNLMQKVGNGLILLFGNKESAMNYSANTYPFRQDSNFLYYAGHDEPDLAVLLDTQSGEQILYGDDLGVEDIIWMGYQESMSKKAENVGIEVVRPMEKLAGDLCKAMAKNRKIHYLPPYREDRKAQIAFLMETGNGKREDSTSEELIRAVVSQRSVKDDNEIQEIESTLNAVTRPMYLNAMKMAKPEVFEYEISGMIEGMALKQGYSMAYPIICSVNGEILHNHYHGNRMKENQLLIIDAGAESRLHYATDITRTIPVGGRFTSRQTDIYSIVLKAETEAISGIQPGIPYRDIHMNAAAIITEGLKSLGLLKGNVADIVSVGAHALFFPHGLGHMMGLDVHDMEDLGEDYVGYDVDVQRSGQFGLAYLRMARKLEPGFVITVEPGIYFIPPLIEKWEAEKKFTEFIRYDKLKPYLDFGGIRIEDDVLVTSTGHHVLGDPIPKTIVEVEQACKI
ncbi:MAG: aminopeptidase P family protein [Bacteroidales bacterium]|nr:aminopeptidase P family protein [Bacteroidales bacterium]MBN2762984.1 aminopeptidase P family protein [Bacteroidales bacterium]